MTFYTYLFSPETYQGRLQQKKPLAGVRKSQHSMAKKVVPGDIFICYLTKVSRFVGAYEVKSKCFIDEEPYFQEENDPFVVRFEIGELAWPELNKTFPIHDDELWNNLSLTKSHPKNSSTWTGMVRNSVRTIPDNDGQLILDLLKQQMGSKAKDFPLEEGDLRKYFPSRVKTAGGTVSVVVPESDELNHDSPSSSPRQSIEIQALLATLGESMGYKIWLPRNDRGAVSQLTELSEDTLLVELPMNYEEVTLKTVEQIDVIWVKGRSIHRAFEVEHTTAIYSGLLRIADLFSLQPNIAIKAHIVAPSERREKVLREISRPVFALLESGPLAEQVSYIAYESLQELKDSPHLAHLSDTVLEEFEERET
jgi:hypothetical protein